SDDRVLYEGKHLSYRGPSAEGTFILNTVGKWVKFDAVLFKKLDREWSLSDFRPFRDERPSIRQEALALLQKGVILFQRKVYDGATRALMECRRHLDGRSSDPVELTIATGLLGCRIVHAFRSRHWPLSMRMAFASQIRWRVRAALTVGDVGYALDLVKFSCRAFGLSATGGSFKFPFQVRRSRVEKVELSTWDRKFGWELQNVGSV